MGFSFLFADVFQSGSFLNQAAECCVNVSLKVDTQSGLVGECGWTPTTNAVSSLTPFIHIYIACIQTQIQPYFHVFIFVRIFLLLLIYKAALLSCFSVSYSILCPDRQSDIFLWKLHATDCFCWWKTWVGRYISVGLPALDSWLNNLCQTVSYRHKGDIFKACKNPPLSLLLASWAKPNEVSVTGAAHSIASTM